MYGMTLLAIRVFLFIVDEFARREHLYAVDSESSESKSQRKELLPILSAYGIAIVIGIFLPSLAVALYSALGIVLVVPFRQIGQLLFRRS